MTNDLRLYCGMQIEKKGIPFSTDVPGTNYHLIVPALAIHREKTSISGVHKCDPEQIPCV